MPTYQEITDKIARIATPTPSVDILRTVERLILNYRALLIRRDLENSRSYHDSLVQTIPEIEVEEVPTIGSMEFRTFSSQRIPSILRLKSGYAIRFAGSPSRNVSYNYVDPSALRIVIHSRYAYKNNIYTIIDGKIKILVSDHSYSEEDTDVDYPEKIRLEAIFENPAALFDYVDEDGKRLYDLDTEFPITEDLEQQITQSILSTEAQLFNPARVNEIHTDPQ